MKETSVTLQPNFMVCPLRITYPDTFYHKTSRGNELATMAKSAGKKQSELIREAVDLFINQYGDSHRKAILKEAAGMWKNRNDIPEFKSVRSQWDRD